MLVFFGCNSSTSQSEHIVQKKTNSAEWNTNKLNGSLFGDVDLFISKDSISEETKLRLVVDSTSEMKHPPMYKATIEYFVFLNRKVLVEMVVDSICLSHPKYLDSNGESFCFEFGSLESFYSIERKLNKNPQYVESLEYLLRESKYEFYVDMEVVLMGLRKYAMNNHQLYQGKFVELLYHYYDPELSSDNDTMFVNRTMKGIGLYLDADSTLSQTSDILFKDLVKIKTPAP